MPNSLKCRLKNLVHQGLLCEKDLSRIYTDNDVVEELEKIRKEAYSKSYYLEWDNRGSTYVQLCLLNRIIDNHIEELNGIYCNHTDTEIAKSFIEDVEACQSYLQEE